MHLGSHLNLRRITGFSFARFRSCGRACFVLLSFPRNIFAGTSQPELEVRAQISRCPSGAGGRTYQRYRLAEQADRYRVRGENLARCASTANTTNESARGPEPRDRRTAPTRPSAQL